MAEGVGFEPTVHYCTRVLQTRRIGQTLAPFQNE